MSFGRNIVPTKIELIRLRRSLKVAKMVHKILDDKREVLLKRIDEMIEDANKAREEIWSPLEDVYNAVRDAYMSLGTNTVESIAMLTPPSIEVDVNVRRIVDVKVPTLQVSSKGSDKLSYGFADTNASVDKASKLIKNILPGICKAAEYENAIFSLAKELEKTQRLINALEYVIMPQYEGAIKFITASLEEREREEFVRLKKVKSILEQRKGV
ncbi:MAG: V-type ATP synthase subunit D [Candidatus Nitrosocaldaceae archaeon]|nr:MAG: V-type ATP synthase subunit D [Candidatus Nitrosocaldaceae archaeon]